MPIQSALDIGGNHFNKDGRDGPIPSQYKNIAVVALGEFCGTFMFLLLSFIGTQVAIDNNSPGSPDARLAPFSLLYIAASFGTALAVNVWIFYRVTGGMFNPAVSRRKILHNISNVLAHLAQHHCRSLLDWSWLVLWHRFEVL